MRAEDHWRVWNNASVAFNAKVFELEREAGPSTAAKFGPCAIMIAVIAQAYREEAERNPE